MYILFGEALIVFLGRLHSYAGKPIPPLGLDVSELYWVLDVCFGFFFFFGHGDVRIVAKVV